MSSSGGTPAAPPQLYFCHQCNRTVRISPAPGSDLVCTTCNGGFLEELENPTPTPNFFPNPFESIFPFLAGGGGAGGAAGGGGEIDTFEDLSAIFGGHPHVTATREPEAFDPMVFFHNYIQTLREGGANIQFVIENNPGGGGGGGDGAAFRLPTNVNVGDYFFGPGLEQLIQQLAENDPNRHGPPPASKSAMEALPTIKISNELLVDSECQCAVCKDSFELDEEVKQMPCKHIYHPDCILPWLQLHNSCPVCRYELPTDDPDYEQRGQESQPANTAPSGEGGEHPETPTLGVGERRIRRIPLPWPFSAAFGSGAETSNSGGGGGGGGSGGHSNPENRDSEPQYEDLD